jgi:hypothetical protein
MLRITSVRSIHSTPKSNLKFVAALYADPVKGYPKSLKDYGKLFDKIISIE